MEFKLGKLNQLKICTKYSDMVLNILAYLSVMPGLRPTTSSLVPDKPAWALGTMSRHSAQTLICVSILYILYCPDPFCAVCPIKRYLYTHCIMRKIRSFVMVDPEVILSIRWRPLVLIIKYHFVGVPRYTLATSRVLQSLHVFIRISHYEQDYYESYCTKDFYHITFFAILFVNSTILCYSQR